MCYLIYNAIDLDIFLPASSKKWQWICIFFLEWIEGTLVGVQVKVLRAQKNSRQKGQARNPQHKILLAFSYNACSDRQPGKLHTLQDYDMRSLLSVQFHIWNCQHQPVVSNFGFDLVFTITIPICLNLSLANLNNLPVGIDTIVLSIFFFFYVK